MSTTFYHPDLAQDPFMLSRHGQSIRNAGDMAQGSGEAEPGMPNGLTDLGIQQAESIYPALHAAGVVVRHVSSSRMDRAIETRDAFVRVHPEPKPTIAPTHIPDIHEVSQRGWSTVQTRDQVKSLRKAAVDMAIAQLRDAGLAPELEGHVAWITRFGEGEAPLGAALRGIYALEAYNLTPGELVFSHAMLNRYMDALATRVPSADRARLLLMLEDGSAAGKIAVIAALKDLGMPTFAAADDKRNQQANGGVTEYTVRHDSGLWIAGRRIEPPKESDTAPFVEHHRDADGMWNRITPGGTAPSNNE